MADTQIAFTELLGRRVRMGPWEDQKISTYRKIREALDEGRWDNAAELEAYFRKYQSASEQLTISMGQLYAARDDMQKDVIDIEATRSKLWEAMTKLAAASRFSTQLDTRLDEKVKALEHSDPQRAQALRQEVLFPHSVRGRRTQ